MDFKEIIKTKEYDFLRTEPRLKDNIILLTLGGSHAYGTNNQNSDIDFRGVALNNIEDILYRDTFEQYIDSQTDTVIYSFNKVISLLINCNPNIIEILGCRPDDYLILTEIGKELLDNKNLFISQRCIKTFGGYATQQIYKLQRNDFLKIEKQNKHAMHVIRLYMMVLDILNHGEIKTYREEEKGLLLSIRDGYFMNEDGSMKKEFYEIADCYENQFVLAQQKTQIPKKPDMNAIKKFAMRINLKITMNNNLLHCCE